MIDKKSQLEVKIEKASRTGINSLEMGIGLGLVVSTMLFGNFTPFPEYKLIVDMAGAVLLGHGSYSVGKKFEYLTKTCKELYQENMKYHREETNKY